MVKIIALGVFLILWPISQSQFYDCVSCMEVLLHTQEKIMKHIQPYVRFIADSKRAVVVQTFLSRCRTAHELAKWDREKYLGNPLNAFALIMRLTRGLQYVREMLNETTAGTGIKCTPDNVLAYPTNNDVNGVINSMLLLQLIYDDLDVMKMANGTLTTSYSFRKPAFVEYTTPMTSCDCFELGLAIYDEKERGKNIAWMKEALRRYTHRVDCPITRVDIYDRLSDYYFTIGEHKAGKYWMQKRVDASPTDPQNKQYKKTLNVLRGLEAINMATPISKPEDKEIDLYPGLCLKTHFSRNASLTCYYAHGPHPFLLLAPMKAERLHLSPDVLLFHDVITDDEIKDIQALARPRLKKIVPHKEGGGNHYCVLRVAWIPDVWSNATLRVSKRIAQFSGLVVNVNTTEEFEVGSYGVGGHYGPHSDWARPNCTIVKRFASAVFYMADVEVGGATVFTTLGLSVFPVKHAALFWWEQDASGNNDINSHHAACPVLRGSKWVLNKKILLSGQELVRPCPVSSARPESELSWSCKSCRGKLFKHRNQSFCQYCNKS